MDNGQSSVALKKCLACGHKHLTQILDLGNQPLANSYLMTAEQEEETFPLRLNFCPECTHLQLGHSVNPDFLFSNYLYVSGTSETGHKHFKEFVKFTEQYTIGNNVLDVACNDGTQLKYFKEAGYNTYGIDPARNLLPRSRQHGTIIGEYLAENNIKSFGVEFDTIVVQNVLAHVPDPVRFLRNCKSALSETGCIFVQTSQANMIANNEFDTIYHEHLSFFSVESFCALAKRCGLSVIDVVRTPIHGTSFIFVLSVQPEDRSEEFIAKEQKRTQKILETYATRCMSAVESLKDTLEAFRKTGATIVGYGAAAKGNTLLNFGNINLDYIVDDNPLKCGLFTPGSRIPICKSGHLQALGSNLVVVPLAWNFYDEIKAKVLKQTKVVKFVRYFPNVVIE